MIQDVAVARRLAERTLELVDIPSVSGREQRLAEHVDAAVPRASFEERFADGEGFFYVTPRRARRPFVLLAGHLDTIPEQENLPGRIEDGWVVGLGASDMKGGLAVMLELAAWIDDARPDRELDVGLLFFTREELPVSESPLPAVFDACPELREADLAVVLEPTDNTIQAGCLGNLNASLVFRGEAAHSARPWLGDNAIARAAEGLLPLTRIPPQPVEIAGLVFTEVLSVTRIEGGVADNVIPDLVTCRLNYRFAPDKTVPEAEARLAELVGNIGELEISSNSPPGRVAAGSPLVERLRETGGFAVEPKQAWTPVAQFTDEGVDAVNLGPGATHYAHKRDERVAIAELERTLSALQRFVASEREA
ncbi:MAG TPA: succinyl-diaminopimelate desuccinylase [Planctomycetota bacterium]|nr:succinyl-diaminopimelate desuccinylase [Planctomycetota bacterium]